MSETTWKWANRIKADPFASQFDEDKIDPEELVDNEDSQNAGQVQQDVRQLISRYEIYDSSNWRGKDVG